MPAKGEIETDRTWDVVVVGAGVPGFAIAWRAAQHGLRVVVIERDRPGSGASSVAAGMLAPVTEADFGENELLRLNLESAELWPGFAAELEERTGMPTGYVRCGAVAVAVDRDDAEEYGRMHALQRALGLDARRLVPSEARRLEPGLAPRIAGAIEASDEAQADPVALIAALERAVTDAGAWSTALDPGVRVRPVKGQLLQLRTREGAPPLARRIVRTPRCYVVPRPDGRVVVGATSEERGFDTTIDVGAVHRLLEAAWAVLPDVWELEFVRALAGLRPATPDNRPLIGPSAREGLFHATGHYRNGILLAPVTAARMLAVLTGERVAA